MKIVERKLADLTPYDRNPHMIHALNNSDKWKMTRWNVENCASAKSAIDYKRKSLRKVKTGAFKWIKQNGKTE